jgi:hypothetical protein
MIEKALPADHPIMIELARVHSDTNKRVLEKTLEIERLKRLLHECSNFFLAFRYADKDQLYRIKQDTEALLKKVRDANGIDREH